MKERQILFSAPMVRALLAGTKTQTRRVVKPPRRWASEYPVIDAIACAASRAAWWWDGVHSHVGVMQRCPYGQPGDRLWVRETWQMVDPIEVPEDRRGSRAPFTGCQGARSIPWVAAYKADGDLSHPKHGPIVWQPSIHMPRWASRITLEITGVRVERLQEIAETDCFAEGIAPTNTPRGDYALLWEQINGPGSWIANPWVWVVEFKRVQG